ncbi:MAG: histidine phosphatase family protein [Chloroflexi bacterium]|nr:MAG: histidine phosphatase family protein [Chloroflexota bacterium]
MIGGDCVRLLLIRHGESQGNAERRVQGWFDSPLTDTGRDQIRALARRLEKDGWGVTALYASTLRRATESGEILAATLGVPLVLDDRLREYDIGVFTGLTWEEVKRRFPNLVAQWETGSRRPPIPGEEGDSAFCTRVAAAFEDIVAAHPPEATVGVVAHGGTFNVYLKHLLGLDIAMQGPFSFSNAALNVVELEKRGLRITLLNDTCHLGNGE